MEKGKLKSWDDSRGFGFVKSDTLNSDVFIHISSLKAMSRKPKVGDFIYFEVQKQADGKSRAINCRIEGVFALKPEMPQKRAETKRTFISSLFSLVVFIGIANFVYNYVNDDNVDTEIINELESSEPVVYKSVFKEKVHVKAIDEPEFIFPEPVVYSAKTINEPKLTFSKEPRFKCDGRQHCSQMTSRAEANFFTASCPNTKMDGDHDGVPCENDTRF